MTHFGILQRMTSLAGAAAAVYVMLALPLVQAQSVSDYNAVPPLLAESATPLVMLAMSNDHQLFYKAFTDWDDLDNDGLVDTTYKHSFEYVGYFDSFKCYQYDTGAKRFEPASITADKYCNSSTSSQWSGNFLNWATMTRMDQVRKVLYGGYRLTDTATATVLERAFLPNDAHSFAKYYNGADLGKLTPFGNLATGLSANPASGITICNTTRHDGNALSQNVTDPPLARVAFGNYALWAANERWQCLFNGEFSGGSEGKNGNDASLSGIHAYASSPSNADKATQADGVKVGDYSVRVSVCKSAALIGRESCKQYPDGNYKPIGILQRFGDDESVMWGLMSGSYMKNKSGGVLRKNVAFITDEINVSTDGTFKPVPATGGIVNTLDTLRLANYSYSDGTYNTADKCSWARNSFSNGECTNWGNPMAEIMLECYRYFAGKQPNSAFHADDSTLLPGLTTQSKWLNPQTEDTACASLNVIAFNASSVSYDGDELHIADLNASKTAAALTKDVGDGEGITNNHYFVGEVGSDNNQLCTAKKVTDFGLVEGICPDAPRLEGSYKMAGIAYHANTQDIRTDIGDRQSVTTYGVALAPALPKVSMIAPGGRKVQILPACNNSFVKGNCGLVDFKIVSQVVTDNKITGAFYVTWEDSEQGGDYDQDMSGILQFELTSATLKITTNVFAQSSTDQMGFGFILGGTTEDGFHAISGVNDFNGFGCSKCKISDSAATRTFTLGASTVTGGATIGELEQPLYYAAKWGGFTDIDGNNKPNLAVEWDKKNNITGALGSDGVPDNYFLAINPKQMDAQLTNILVSILERTASGTSAAVVTNTGTGEGALYQALYNSRFAAANGVDYVSWVGTLNALFIDAYGRVREDNAPPFGSLTNADYVIDVFYDKVSQKTQIQRYLPGADGTIASTVGSPVDVLDIKPIWSARDRLGEISDYVTQREEYGNTANTGRYILTGIDKNGDGQINATSGLVETEPFVADTFEPGPDNNNFRLLGMSSVESHQAVDVVNYIRGEQISGFRNRRIDVNGDGKLQPVLLGDIVHSSPIAVGRPSSGFELAFGDDTYRAFRQHYQQRRQMVYVGANDGMIHAFNGGFFNSISNSYELALSGETPHPLGSELWAYVPYNLLPHLKWLTRPDYPHVYYMDGSIKQFDVNVFADDEDHPGGWGTILVAGMRFGGGEYTLDPNSDADGNANDDITLRSAYVVLDITNPEKPPVVLAEITHDDLGYTTSEPALLKMRAAHPETGDYSTPSVNDWYLVFGSGPAGATEAGRAAALNSALSEKTSKVFAFNLKSKNLQVFDLGEAASFVGGVQTVDWTRDYIDDALYLGTVAGSISSPAGHLYRAVATTANGTLSLDFSKLLASTQQPFSATPLTVRDRLGDLWVYAGTGRFFVTADNFTTAQQSYYGIKEPNVLGELQNTELKIADLVNTSDIRVFSDGSIQSKANPGSNITLPGQTDPAKTFADVYNAVQAKDGWYFHLARARARNVTQAVVSDQSLVFTEYQPSGLKCQPEGFGFINAPHLQVGIPGEFSPLGTNASVINAQGAEESKLSETLGLGSPSSPVVHQRGDGKRVAIVQSSTGELSTTIIETGSTAGARESWRELFINWK